MKHGIQPSDRPKHVYISGKTRHGKSTLIHAMAHQDIVNGHGVCVIDYKGDLVPSLLDWIPKSRRDDVILLDLDHPVPLNVLKCESQKEHGRLVSETLELFKRLDKSWGDRMEAILLYTLHTLLRHGSHAFLDIFRILAEPDYRNPIIHSPVVMENFVLRNFWHVQFEKRLPKNAADPIAITRMPDFLLSDALSTILGTTNAPFDIEEAMNARKIILVNLREATNEAKVYGSILMSKIQQAAFRRVRIKDKRCIVPFMLYVDEFQKFTSSAFEDILSMAGGLGLCLTLSNQFLDQIKDADVRSAIINNVSTFFLFRMSAANSHHFVGELQEQREEPNYYPHYLKQEVADKQYEVRKLMAQNRSAMDDYDEAVWDGDLEYARLQLARAQHDLDVEQSRPPDPPPFTYLQMLPKLPVGKAIYRAANGRTSLVSTPAPPPPLWQVGKTSHADHIRARTRRIYAPNAQNALPATVDNTPLLSAPIPHSEGNGSNNDKPEPGAEGRITELPNKPDKAKGLKHRL